MSFWFSFNRFLYGDQGLKNYVATTSQEAADWAMCKVPPGPTSRCVQTITNTFVEQYTDLEMLLAMAGGCLLLGGASSADFYGQSPSLSH